MQKNATHISISNISFFIDDNIYFKDLNFDLPINKWTCLLGTSGVGKSSILKILAGLMPKNNTNYINPHSKAITYMAQTDCLMPWLNIINNVTLGASLRHDKTHALKQKAFDLLTQVGLKDKTSDYPYQLSGGMRQRAALIRTLLEDKPIVLMDEPFSALDALTRLSMQRLAFELLKDKTVLLVTHDPWEALRLGSHILIMKDKPATLTPLTMPKHPPLRDSSDPELISFHRMILKMLMETRHAGI